MAHGGLLWVAAEGIAMASLALPLVRWDALMGRSEDQLNLGIPPVEQAIWNLQKFLRCALFVLCFSSAFLRRLPHKARSWSSLVFAHIARELWLLSNDEAEAYLFRRRACFILTGVIRAAFGTARSFLHLRDSQEKSADRSAGTSVCSGFAVGWIIFLLDVLSNSGFLLGFLAGRSYFRAAAAFTEGPHTELDTEKEALLRSPTSARDRPEQWWKSDITRPSPIRRRDAAVGTDGDNAATTNGEKPMMALPSSRVDRSRSESRRSPAQQRSCDWNQLEDMFQERGPIFWKYANLALVGLSVASVLECYFLQYWEVGILGGREDEVDVFHSQAPYFVPTAPDFSRWRAKRVVLGSWRDVIYLALVYPVPCSACLGTLVALGAIATRRKWRAVQSAVHHLAIGALTFIVLVSAHRAYFALACLLICWECRVLEIKALRFARAFAQLNPRQRWHWHAELGSEIKALDERLSPLIGYAFLQRFAYLALDLARQSCEQSLPFNLVHYMFRHVMFLAALSVTLWRIGKLNFAHYEKLHNTVMDTHPHNWAEIGKPGVTQNDVILQRNHLEDWRHYMNHNIESGRRDACVCVFHLRFSAKSHLVALSVFTILTLPLLNKAMDTYGRHVVNERLLPTTSAPAEPSPSAFLAAIAEVRGMCSAAVPPGDVNPKAPA